MPETFAIAPTSDRTLWVIAALVVLLLVGLAAVMVKTALGARASRFEVSVSGLRITGDFYGRQIRAASLRAGEARVVNLREVRELQPSVRTMGTAVPGYNAGWFKLRNGEKALLYLTDRSRAVYVPTDEGYSLLLSPSDPESFLRSLRAISAK